MKYTGAKILDGNEIDELIIDEIYTYFKEDLGLDKPASEKRQELDFSDISSVADTKIESIQLKSIKSVKNVNALALDQTIKCGPGLTVVYGDNGTGKSGYTRLLNNAFRSRGDTTILPNVFNPDAEGEPQCQFEFSTGGVDSVLSYPEDSKHPAFSKLSIFDSQSIHIHLEKRNSLNFTPSGFWFFDKLIAALGSVEDLLLKEISDKDEESGFDLKFPNENEVGELVSKLKDDFDLKKLEALSAYGKIEDDELNLLLGKKSELDGQKIPENILKFQKTNEEIESLKTGLGKMVERFSDEKKLKYENAITKLKTLGEASSAEGVELLKEHSIADSEKKPWKDFLVAAREYISSIKEYESYPSEEDSCVFCHQALSKEQVALISTYWSFLKSDSEIKLKEYQQKISIFVGKIEDWIVPVFPRDGLAYKAISEANPELVKSIEENIKVISKNLATLKESMTDGSWSETLDPVLVDSAAIDLVCDNIGKNITALSGDEVKRTLKDLSGKIDLLRDRFLLNKVIADMRAYSVKKMWAKNAAKKKSKLSSRGVTALQKVLFDEHVTDVYTECFSKECRNLGAPNTVSINQKPAKGNTMRSLVIEKSKASQVLSEGEQRAVAIADFLAEAILNPFNDGLIFDDPVTSQDHRRKLRISNRIVDLAKKKQIVVFTHDIPFFLGLTYKAQEQQVELATTTIRCMGDTPGIIDPQLPWIAQKSKDRLGFLRNRLVGLVKKMKTDHEDECLLSIKSWYGLLREGWERAIEERLLKGVVERFRPGVESQRLKKMIVNDSLLESVEKGMTDSSKWAHDSAAGLNPPAPTEEEMTKHLKSFEDFLKACPAQ